MSVPQVIHAAQVPAGVPDPYPADPTHPSAWYTCRAGSQPAISPIPCAWHRVRPTCAAWDLCGVDHLRHAQGYPLNPSSEPDPVRRSSRCDGGCRRAMRAPTVGIKRARYATPSTVAPAWSAKRCENARHQDSLRIAQALRRATQSALPVLHTALSGRDSGS